MDAPNRHRRVCSHQSTGEGALSAKEFDLASARTARLGAAMAVLAAGCSLVEVGEHEEKEKRG